MARITYNACFAIFLLFIFSCTSVNEDVTTDYRLAAKHLHYIKEIEDSAYMLDKHNYLSLSVTDFDSITGEWIIYLSYFSKSDDFSEQIISQEDLTSVLYGDTLLFYTSDKSEKQLFIWKKEGEYWSYLDIFLFYKDTINSIGNIILGEDCKDCDAHNFPEDRIYVQETDETLKIRFSGQTIYRGTIAADSSYHPVHIHTDNLHLIYNGSNSEIIY